MDDQKQKIQTTDPANQPHSTVSSSIYPETTRQSYGDQAAPIATPRQEDSRRDKLIRERMLSLTWLAIPMLVFGSLVLFVLLFNSDEFENYLFPRNYQVISYVTASMYVAGAIVLLVCRSVSLAKVLATVLFVSFVISILETVHTVLTNFTVSISSGPNVAIALAVYFLTNMYFAFSTWSLAHEVESLSG